MNENIVCAVQELLYIVQGMIIVMSVSPQIYMKTLETTAAMREIDQAG